ncbi:MAG TPA: hypothetical protein VGM53_22170 [Streptosporangiaceae bacterium]|jgi:hypothetical protein
MPVTDEQVAWLRTYLAGESEVAQQLYDQLTGAADAAGLGALVYAAFVIAARQKFASGWARADLIKFIAQTRQSLGVRPDVFDPLVAENQLARALGEQSPDSPDVKANARAQLVLLNALVVNADLEDEAVFSLLIRARKMADRILNDAV